MTQSRNSDSLPAVVICSYASDPRHLAGKVTSCSECQAEVWLTNDTRQHVERKYGVPKLVCPGCATRLDPSAPFEVTPLGAALLDAYGRRS